MLLQRLPRQLRGRGNDNCSIHTDLYSVLYNDRLVVNENRQILHEILPYFSTYHEDDLFTCQAASSALALLPSNESFSASHRHGP